MSEDLVERILKREGEPHSDSEEECYNVYNGNKTEIRAYAIITFTEGAYGTYIPPHAYGTIDYYKKLKAQIILQER
jgi:hypothetical protein